MYNLGPDVTTENLGVTLKAQGVEPQQQGMQIPADLGWGRVPLPEERREYSRDHVGKLESAKAAFNQTWGKKLWDMGTEPSFEPTPHYAKVGGDMDKRIAMYEQYNGTMSDSLRKEIKGTAVSDDHFDYIVQKHLQDQDEQDRASDNFWTSVATDIVADPLNLVTFGTGTAIKAGAKAGLYTAKAAKTAGAVAGAAIGGGAGYLTNEYESNPLLMATFGAAGHALGGYLMNNKGMLNAKQKKLLDDVGAFKDVPLAERSKVVQNLMKVQSFADHIAVHNPELSKTVFGTLGNYGTDGLVGYQRTFAQAMDADLMPFEVAMKRNNVGVPMRPWKVSEQIENTKIIMNDLDDELAKLAGVYKHHGAEGADMYINNMKAGPVKDLVTTYRDTKFAQNTLKRMKAAGVEGAESVADNPYYVPRKWSSDKMADYIMRTGEPGMKKLARKFGNQFLGAHGNSDELSEALGLAFMSRAWGQNVGMERLTTAAKETGQKLKKEINAIMADPNSGFKDELQDILENLGILEIKEAGAIGRTQTSLRRRFDFDMFDDSDGFKLADFVDKDVFKKLETYKLQSSSRIAMHRAGFTGASDFNQKINAAADNMRKAGVPQSQINEAMQHLEAISLGKPMGGKLNETVRSLQNAASMLHLGNTAIYNLAEYANIAYEHGVWQTAKAFMKNIDSRIWKGLTPADAQDFQELMSAVGYMEGRIKPMVSLLADGYEAANTRQLTGWIDQMAQTTRYVNGGEFVRRHQLNMNAALLEQRVSKELAGGTSDYLERIGMKPEQIAAFRNLYNKHGMDIRKWGANNHDAFMHYMIGAMDHTVLSIRKGQRPMLMDTQVGKIIFPYMSFVWGSHNQIMRRIGQNDGVAGMATIMLMQAPLAVTSGATANIVNGRQWDDNLHEVSLKAMGTLGLGAIAGDLLFRGELGGASTVFAVPNAVATLAKGVATGDPSKILKSIPGIGVALPARILAGQFSE